LPFPLRQILFVTACIIVVKQPVLLVLDDAAVIVQWSFIGRLSHDAPESPSLAATLTPVGFSRQKSTPMDMTLYCTCWRTPYRSPVWTSPGLAEFTLRPPDEARRRMLGSDAGARSVHKEAPQSSKKATAQRHGSSMMEQLIPELMTRVLEFIGIPTRVKLA